MFWKIRNARELGAFIRDIRIDRNLTQHQLADRAGVSRSWLIGVEQGKRTGAEMSKIFALMRALDTTMFCEPPDGDYPATSQEEAPSSPADADATVVTRPQNPRDGVSPYLDPSIRSALEEQIASSIARPSGITTALNKQPYSTGQEPGKPTAITDEIGESRS